VDFLSESGQYLHNASGGGDNLIIEEVNSLKEQTSIPYTLKQRCVALFESGKSYREIYNFYISVMGQTQSFKSFRITLRRWKKKVSLDEKIIKDQQILHDVNIALGYNMNKATVQYNAQTKEIEKVWARINESTSSVNQLIEVIKDVKPIQVEIDPIEVKEKRLLEIPLFDSHFGVSDYEYYKPTQAKIMDKLSSRKWEEVLFILGQDMLHNDDFRGRTSNGTQIETVDMVKAWNDARMFYQPLLEQAIKQSNSVKVMYAKANHDESLSWAFVQMVKVMYPQIQFDDEIIERKVHTFGLNFIGVTHGDKARKNLHNIFPIEFPVEWSKAKNREIHIGHFHVEDAKDIFGMVVRTLATKNKTDKWHKDNGYVGAHKRFMLFEYSEDNLESIHYV
jgi:hypothetical protein